MTDRHRLAPGVLAIEAVIACIRAQVAQAVEAEIDAVQIRERDLDARSLIQVTKAAVAVSRGSLTRILVNDRVDVALAAAADGVHLRADSPPAWRIRPLVPKSFVIGRSVHSMDELASAGVDVDYLFAGTVWPSFSKPPGHSSLGPSELARLVGAAQVPVIAIGGMDRSRIEAVAQAGAAGLAAIGLFIEPTNPPDSTDSTHVAAGGCRARPLVKLVRELRAAFAAARSGESIA